MIIKALDHWLGRKISLKFNVNPRTGNRIGYIIIDENGNDISPEVQGDTKLMIIFDDKRKWIGHLRGRAYIHVLNQERAKQQPRSSHQV